MSEPKAVGDLVIVRPILLKKEGKLFLPEGATTNRGVEFGEVVSVGEDYTWGLIPGQQIIFMPGEGTPIEDGKYRSLKPERILAILFGNWQHNLSNVRYQDHQTHAR